MMQPLNKAARMDAFVDGLAVDGSLALDPCYQGYFRCFNAGEYYEAHDVLEHLWLREGRGGANYAFYKGLIQVAGAFVHLRKQYEHPAHAKHGRRLGPAGRLFDLALANLAAFGPKHLGLDLVALRALCVEQKTLIVASGLADNPWRPSALPRLLLEI